MEIDLDLSHIGNVMNPHFMPLLKDKNRYMVLYGGGGSGKSVFIAQKLLLRILVGMKMDIRHKFICLRKTAPASRLSLHAEFKKLIYDDPDKGGWGLGNDLVTENKSFMSFMFKNGSEILTGGMDDAEKIKSIQGITGAWLEEATEFTYNDFDQIDLRLRGKTDTYKQIIISFNPISKFLWPYGEFFVDPPENCTVHHSTYKDNRFLDAEYIKKLQRYEKVGNMLKHSIYALGDWGSVETLIYNNYELIDWDDNKKFKHSCYGLDYGWNAPAALTFIGEHDEEYYIKELLYQNKLTHNDLIGMLGNIIPLNQRRKRIIYVDSAEPELIYELNRSGFMANSSDKSRKAGIDYCKEATLKIDNKSINGIKELQTYSYIQDKNDKMGEEPAKGEDHFCDSFRYGLYTHFGRPRPKASIIFV